MERRRNSASRSLASIVSDESAETLVSDLPGNYDRRTSLLSSLTATTSHTEQVFSQKDTSSVLSPGSSKTSLPRTVPRRSSFFNRPDATLLPKMNSTRRTNFNSSPSHAEVSLAIPPFISKVPMPPNRVVTGFRATTIPEYKGHMPRCGHTAITYKRDFYIFGGVNNKNQYPNHIYCHEKRSLQWEEIRGVGVVPSGRANHSAIVHKNKMIIYGGHRYLDVFDDLYSYDLDARRWDKIGYEKRQGPGPVFLHAAVYITPTQSMAILGGFHQREYNMYVGHIFDIRNRIWTGIPGPHAINLQHLQLVTATFDIKSTSIAVLGFTEANAGFDSRMPSPYVYLMNIHNYIWTKVDTSSSPESPIPFRLDIIWEKFMREFIMMGGYHDSVMQSWYFPITIDSIIDARASKDSTSSSLPINTRGGRARYGFFKLQLDDMKWSIVPTTLPKKLMAELAQKNRDSILQKKVKTSTNSNSVASNLAGSGSSSKGMLRNMQSSVAGESGLVHIPTAVEVTPQKKAMLFSVDGDPQFQRKYAYAANRDGNTKNGGSTKKSKAMQYLVMHGGLDPGNDYTMLMLTPQISRTDAFTASRAESDEMESTAASRSGKWSDDDDDAPRSVIAPKSGRRAYLFESMSTMANEDSNLDGDRSEDGETAKDHCLLPILPCMQNKQNLHRFAVLFHQSNSIRKEDLLAYPTTPAAILEAEDDIEKWAEQYYADTRKWLGAKLQVIVQEDKQARRLQRKQLRNSQTQDGGSGDDDSSSEDNSSTNLAKPKPEKPPPPSLQDHSREAFATRRVLTDSQEVQSDFFTNKGLHLFGLDDFMKKTEERKSPAPLPGIGSTSVSGRNDSSDYSEVSLSAMGGIDRLNMKVKRHQEQQRLPSAVFCGEDSGTNLGDLGSAMAFVLMQNALQDIPQFTKEDRARRALIRWRFLRSLVRTGEAAFIIYRVSQEEAKMKGLTVTSSPGLLLAPELHLVGPTRPYKVSARPIPYIAPQAPTEIPQFAEVTPSGMVVYHISQFN